MNNQNNMNNMNGFQGMNNQPNNMNYMNNQPYNMNNQQNNMNSQNNGHSTNNGFCQKCGQKMTNPKYCLHCGTQTDLFIEEHKQVALQNEEERKQSLQKSFKILQKVYFIMLAISIVIIGIGKKYLLLGLTIGAFALIAGGGTAKAYAVLGFGIPLVYYVSFWIVAFKTFIRSVLNIKYEKSLSTIGTAILSFASLISAGILILLICIVLSAILTVAEEYASFILFM